MENVFSGWKNWEFLQFEYLRIEPIFGHLPMWKAGDTLALGDEYVLKPMLSLRF